MALNTAGTNTRPWSFTCLVISSLKKVKRSFFRYYQTILHVVNSPTCSKIVFYFFVQFINGKSKSYLALQREERILRSDWLRDSPCIHIYMYVVRIGVIIFSVTFFLRNVYSFNLLFWTVGLEALRNFLLPKAEGFWDLWEI